MKEVRNGGKRIRMNRRDKRFVLGARKKEARTSICQQWSTVFRDREYRLLIYQEELTWKRGLRA